MPEKTPNAALFKLKNVFEEEEEKPLQRSDSGLSMEDVTNNTTTTTPPTPQQ